MGVVRAAPTTLSRSLMIFGNLLLVGLATWVYWPIFVSLVQTWWSEPEYSHGYVVALFSAYLLYRNRGKLQQGQPRTSWWGVPVLAAALGLYLFGAYVGIDYLAAVSLVPCCLGLALLLGGWTAVKWSAPASLFLLFLIPLPFRVARALATPLRGIATKTSGYALQVLGFPVIVEGFTLRLDDYQIAIAEACSGLSMLYVFVALAAAVVIVSKRPILDRALILVGALPIAVVANVLRIILTAVAFSVAGKEAGEFIFHDLAGWLMMPIALGLMYLELKLIDVILVPTSRPPQEESLIPALRL